MSYYDEAKLKNVYCGEFLTGQINSAQRDIDTAIAYMDKVRARMAELGAVAMEKRVYLHRRVTYTNHVMYEVSINIVPIDTPRLIPSSIIHPRSDFKNFVGSKRKEAIEYAEDLVRQYGAKIVVLGSKMEGVEDKIRTSCAA